MPTITHTLHADHHTYIRTPYTHMCNPSHILNAHPHILVQAAGAEVYGAGGLGPFMEAVWFALQKEVSERCSNPVLCVSHQLSSLQIFQSASDEVEVSDSLPEFPVHTGATHL